ncbi:MAG: hypothetical protein ISR98_00710 [Parcubacteria group bacterium]|nr:hypothetical protein [Parcubacteria group bacterium]
MLNLITLYYVRFFWKISGKKLVNITYISLFGLFLTAVTILLFLLQMIGLKTGMVGTSIGISLIFTQPIILRTLPELPEFIVEKVGELLVDKTDYQITDSLEKECITTLKDLLSTYVSSRKNEDFSRLRLIYNSYIRYLKSIEENKEVLKRSGDLKNLLYHG